MNHFFKYYSLNTIFYLSEIVIFIFIYPSWPFDIFWFNIILRFLSAILFAIFARILIFNDANNFYKKLSPMLNPLMFPQFQKQNAIIALMNLLSLNCFNS